MIIGICGLAGSGKDTAADSLVLGHHFVKLAFADLMKRFCKEVFDFSDEQLWGPSANRNAPDPRYPRKVYGSDEVHEYLTPRYALQTLGTEWGRDCYPNVWVDYALRKAKELDGAEGVHYDAKLGIFRCARPRIEGVAISDVRFWNELESIKKAGGKVIRVKRSGAGLGGANGLHPSEVEQASIADACFDAVIQNDGSLADLHDKVGEVLTSF
jgi:hypothetical protein